MATRKSTWRGRLGLLLGLLAYFSLVYWLFPRLGIGCVFRDVLGFPCPGCGMSRAFLALLRLDVVAAFRYNPLIFGMPYVFVYLFFDLKPERLHRRILLGIGVLALIHWTYVLFQH